MTRRFCFHRCGGVRERLCEGSKETSEEEKTQKCVKGDFSFLFTGENGFGGV